MKNPLSVSTPHADLGQAETAAVVTSETPTQRLASASVVTSVTQPKLTQERREKLLADFEENIRRLAKNDKYRKRHGLDEDKIQSLCLQAQAMLATMEVMRDTSDPWPRAIGETQVFDGSAHQKRSTVHNEVFESAQHYATWFASHSDVGIKGSGPCVYDCLFAERGAPNKYNCVAVQTITFDFDSHIVNGVVIGALRDWSDVKKVIKWLRAKGWGAAIHTTSSHCWKKNGRICLKVQIPCEPISYIERYEIGMMLHAEMCLLLEVEGPNDPRFAEVDQIVARAIQLQHVPRWQTQDHVDNAIRCFILEGKAADLTEYRAKMGAKDKAKKAKVKAEKDTLDAANAERAVLGLPPIQTHDAPTEEKLKQARTLLGKLGISDNSKGGQAMRFRAIQIGRRCGLTIEQWLPDLLAWGALGCWDPSELTEKAHRTWDEGHLAPGSALLPSFSSPSTFTAIMELDLGGVGQGGSTDTEQTTSPSRCAADPLSFKENQKDSTPTLSDFEQPHHSKPLAPGAGVMDKWWGGLNNPTKVTKLHQPALPVLVYELLAAKLVVLESPCGTQKSRAYIPMLRARLLEGERVIVVVPGQSLSQDLAALINEGLPMDCRIQSHMDAGVDWTKSIVCCINSVPKIRLFSVAEVGIQEFSLGEKPTRRKVADHPVNVLVVDEFGELNDVRVGSLICHARLADAVHGRMRDLCASAKHIVACQAHSELDDLSCLIFDWLGWGGAKAKPFADWHLVVNTFHHLKPDVFVGSKPQRVRKERLEAWRKGIRSITSFSTVNDSRMEANLWAMQTMSEMAGFDVGPYLGPGFVNARLSEEELPELVEELKRRGLVLDQVRPTSILINKDTRKNPEVKAFLKSPNMEILKYGAVFHTASVKSGFSIYTPCAVFMQLRAGKGPDSKGLHQMGLRCRLMVDNRMHVSIVGHCVPPSYKLDEKWWFRHLTRYNEETEKFLGDGTGGNGPAYRLERREEDDEVYLVEFNETLMWAKARALARHQRRLDISDKRNDLGEVVEWGVLTSFWRNPVDQGGCGWHVIPMYACEEEKEWVKDQDQVKSEEEEEKTRAKNTRQEEARKVAAAKKITREAAEKLRKDHLGGDKDTHYQLANFDLRYRYGLEEVTVDDVEWDRKHGDELAVYAMIKALKTGKDKVKATRLEYDSPIKVHHDHRPAAAERLIGLLEELGLGDLGNAAVNGYEIPNLSLLLEHRVDEQQILRDDHKVVWKEEDKEKNRFTIAFLRGCGVRTIPSRRRANKQAYKRVVDAEWLALVDAKSALQVLRATDMEEAKKKWAEIEQRSVVGPMAPPVPVPNVDLLAGILDEAA